MFPWLCSHLAKQSPKGRIKRLGVGNNAGRFSPCLRTGTGTDMHVCVHTPTHPYTHTNTHSLGYPIWLKNRVLGLMGN